MILFDKHPRCIQEFRGKNYKVQLLYWLGDATEAISHLHL